MHFEELAGRDADRALRRAMLASIAAQVRHLARVAGWELTGAARLRALKGLIGGSVALGGPEQRILRALRGLERELSTQILPDGGHLTRNPSVQLQVLRDLIDIRAMLRAATLDVPAALTQTIEAMAPMLRLFRHGDRGLALFNNAVEEDPVLVDLVLTRSESRGHAPPQAPDSGFQRLTAGQTLVIADTGKPPPSGFDGVAHAGMLSFELSHGRERIVVNCGGYRGAKPAWRRLSRASAAHSVLVAADTNAVEVLADGSLGRGPGAVTCERAEEGGHQWIAAAHDGYQRRYGLTYARELYLAAGGDDMRGEDRLTGRSDVPVCGALSPAPFRRGLACRGRKRCRAASAGRHGMAAACRRRRDEPRRQRLSRLGRGAPDAADRAERHDRPRWRDSALGAPARAGVTRC